MAKRHIRVGACIGGFSTLQEELYNLQKLGMVPSHVQITCSRSLPSENSIKTWNRVARKHCKLVLHAPFWINLCRTEEETVSSVRYLVKMAETLYKMGGLGVVTHLGWRGRVDGSIPEIPLEQARDNLVNNLKYLSRDYMSLGVDLLIENSAGSFRGFPFGSIDDVVFGVQETNHPNVRVCFDTCHAYADGEELDPSLEKIGSRLGLIHLNPTNSKVSKGSHKDLHSFDRLRDSVHIKPEYFRLLFRKVNVPVIMERKDQAIIVDDFQFLIGV